jgi:methylenetetrahydrofolate reductase (NADPH)
LRGLADAVNVTDGAGARAHLAALASAKILDENGIEPILQLTCRDRNRIAIQSDLMGAAAFGIRNLLMLRGDDPKQGDQPDAKPVFDLDSRGLLETARSIRDQGQLPHGRKVAGRAQFFLGCAEMPTDPKPDWKPSGLAAKIASGAQFAQTQFCMDAGVVERWCRRLAEAGIPHDFYLLIGVAPLRSAKSARWMKENLFGTVIPEDMIARMEGAADPQAEGIKVCVELMQALCEIPGVAGVHLMAPNNDAAIPAVISAFGKRQRKEPTAAAPARAESYAGFLYLG